MPRLTFLDGDRVFWKVEDLEAYFGQCPLRSVNDAFANRTVCFNLAAKPFPPLDLDEQDLLGVSGLVDAMAEQGPGQALLERSRSQLHVPQPTNRIGSLLASLRSYMSGNQTAQAMEALDELESLIAVLQTYYLVLVCFVCVNCVMSC